MSDWSDKAWAPEPTQPRLSRAERSAINQANHKAQRESDKATRTPLGASADEARETVTQAITDAILSAVQGDASVDTTDKAIIATMRATIAKILPVVLPSLMLMDGEKLIKAITDLTNTVLILEGRATTITEDKTALTQEQREKALARVAELMGKQKGE